MEQKIRTVFAVLAIAFGWLVLAGPCMACFRLLPFPAPLGRYLGEISSSFPMAVLVLLVCPLLLGTRPWRMTGPHTFPAMAVAGFSFFGIQALVVFVRFLAHGAVAARHPDPGLWWGMLPCILLCTCIQSTAEEFLMRIIPSRLCERKWAASLLCTVLFVVPHLGNRELEAGNALLVVLSYAAFGFWGTWESLSLGTFGYSIGVHIANNLCVSLVCNYPSSRLETPSLLIDTAPTGTLPSLLVLLATLAISGLCTSRFLRYHAGYGEKKNPDPNQESIR